MPDPKDPWGSDPWGDEPGPNREEQRSDSEDPWSVGPEPDRKQRQDPRRVIKQGGPNGNEVSSAFKRSFFPVLGLSLVSLLGSVFDPIYMLWFIAVIYAGAMVLIGLILGIIAITSSPKDRSGAEAAGMLAGVAVGVIALAATCFVNLATWELIPEQ